MASAALFTILLAIPFVPGAEIGLAMLTMLGPPIAILVYGCGVVGLSLSFAAGRILPFGLLVRLAAAFRLRSIAASLEALAPLDYEARLNFLMHNAPNRVLPFVLRHRYLGLALALNVPGNVIVGGGGGLLLMAGVSRIYAPLPTLLAIALGVAPAPLAVLAFGKNVLAA